VTLKGVWRISCVGIEMRFNLLEIILYDLKKLIRLYRMTMYRINTLCNNSYNTNLTKTYLFNAVL
jgi:hypothetical protein